MKSYLFLGIILFSNVQAKMRVYEFGKAMNYRMHAKPKSNSIQKDLDSFKLMVNHQLWQLEKNPRIETGEDEILRAAAGYLFTINMQKEYGNILHEAVDQGDKKYVKVLCALSPVDFILRHDEDGKSALGYAIQLGDVEMVKIFLQTFGNNALRYLTDREGWLGLTPLHVAVKYAAEGCASSDYGKRKEIVALLLNAAGVDAPWLVLALDNQSRIPLAYANSETREMLLNALGLSLYTNDWKD